jgi:photosystem II stability/assembly factor-like uncharacterized protein
MRTSVAVALIVLSNQLFAQVWKPMGPPGGVVNGISIDPQETNTVFAVTGGEDAFLFKTTDGGLSSRVIEDSAGPVHISTEPLINPRHADTMYAGTLRSFDRGETWHSIGVVVAAMNSREPRHLLGTRYGQQLLASFDGGDEWSLLHTFKNIGFVAGTVADTSVYYASGDDSLAGIHRSTNGGRSWRVTSLQDITVLSLAVSPLDAQVVYAGTMETGLFKTTDGGTSWCLVLPITRVHDVAIDPTDTAVVYVAGGGNAFKTTNGGIHWSVIDSGLPNEANREVYAVTVNPVTPNEMYAGTYGFGVFKSIDAGATWYQTNVTRAWVLDLSFGPQQPTILFAGTPYEGFMRTTDGGATWGSIDCGLPEISGAFFRQMRFSAADPSVAYATCEGNGLRRSTNGGVTWQPTSPTGSMDAWAWSLAIHPLSADTVYLGETGWMARNLHRSTDGGGTWQNLHILNGGGAIEQIEFDPNDASKIYVCAGDAGFFGSTDDGHTWNTLNTGLRVSDPPLLVPVKSLALASQSGLAYVAQEASGNYRGGVFKSSNGGTSWKAIDGDLAFLDKNVNVQAIAISPLEPSHLYAALKWHGQFSTYSAGGVYRTTDEGSTWQQVFRGSCEALGFDPLDGRRIYVATNHGVYTAIDTTLIVSVKNIPGLPQKARLYQNYPNPFNSQTIIRYSTTGGGKVNLRIFNILGQEVRKAQRIHDDAGEYQFVWDGKDNYGHCLASGSYICRLEMLSCSKSIKLVLLR